MLKLQITRVSDDLPSDEKILKLIEERLHLIKEKNTDLFNREIKNFESVIYGITEKSHLPFDEVINKSI